MPQMIHYQDDLFFLSVLVKTLDAGLSTEADPEHFRERIAGDIFFLDASIRTFHGLLAQNALLMDRAEYLKLLDRTAHAFCLVLERLLSGVYPRSEAYEAYRSQLEALRQSLRALLAEMDALLSKSLSGETEADLVSQDELSGLLQS